MFYSKSTNGFYLPKIHGESIPTDAVEITGDEHAALMSAQAQGMIIQGDDQGRPFAAFQTYTIEETRSGKLNALAAYRFQRETAGITLNGAVIRTDRESQAMIAGAKNYSDLTPGILIDWKSEGGWIQIDRQALLAVGQAVGAYVQACFSQERVHAEAIAGLSTLEEIASYNFETGWPE